MGQKIAIATIYPMWFFVGLKCNNVDTETSIRLAISLGILITYVYWIRSREGKRC